MPAYDTRRSNKTKSLIKDNKNTQERQVVEIFDIYSKVEIAYTLLSILKTPIKDLASILEVKGKDLPALEAVAIRAILKSYSEGKLWSLMQLMHLLYGPSESGNGIAREIENTLQWNSGLSVEQYKENLTQLVGRLDGEINRIKDIETQKKKAKKESSVTPKPDPGYKE